MAIFLCYMGFHLKMHSVSLYEWWWATLAWWGPPSQTSQALHLTRVGSVAYSMYPCATAHNEIKNKKNIASADQTWIDNLVKSKSALLAAGGGNIPIPGDIHVPLSRPLVAILVLERRAKIPGGRLDSLECQMGPGIPWMQWCSWCGQRLTDLS